MRNSSIKNIFAFSQTYIEISDLLHLLASFTSVAMQYLFLFIAIWDIVLVTVQFNKMHLGTKIQDTRPGQEHTNLEE